MRESLDFIRKRAQPVLKRTQVLQTRESRLVNQQSKEELSKEHVFLIHQITQTPFLQTQIEEVFFKKMDLLTKTRETIPTKKTTIKQDVVFLK